MVLDFKGPTLPVKQIPSLVTPEDQFHKAPLEREDLNLDEVESEWRAQIISLIDRGIQPTHLDGHHHLHFHPKLVAITCKLALEFNLPIRGLPVGYDTTGYQEEFKVLEGVRHTDYCLVDFYDELVDVGYFTGLLEKMPELKGKTVEVMCHPAFLDDVILKGSSYNVPRVKELEVLKSPEVLTWVKDNGIELVNYSSI